MFVWMFVWMFVCVLVCAGQCSHVQSGCKISAGPLPGLFVCLFVCFCLFVCLLLFLSFCVCFFLCFFVSLFLFDLHSRSLVLVWRVAARVVLFVLLLLSVVEFYCVLRILFTAFRAFRRGLWKWFVFHVKPGSKSKVS